MHSAFYRSAPRVLLLAIAALVPACKSIDVPKLPGVTPYRMVIQQGNFLSQEMVSQLKPGMTKEQVRFILGTPLLNDIFHADRWDYVFFRETPNGKRDQRNLSVIFENNKLTRVLGDLMPAEGATTPQATGFDPLTKPEPPAKPGAAPAAAPAEVAKPAAVAPKPAADAAKPEPAAQNGSAASDTPETKPEAAAAPKAEKKKSAEGDSERGFFGRMLEKIGL
jgi:outer membrane protein assembly factor BamE